MACASIFRRGGEAGDGPRYLLENSGSSEELVAGADMPLNVCACNVPTLGENADSRKHGVCASRACAIRSIITQPPGGAASGCVISPICRKRRVLADGVLVRPVLRFPEGSQQCQLIGRCWDERKGVKVLRPGACGRLRHLLRLATFFGPFRRFNLAHLGTL